MALLVPEIPLQRWAEGKARQTTHPPQELEHLEMPSPYLFVHFNIQPVGHLVIL